MTSLLPKDLAALGLAPDMLSPAEQLMLPAPDVDAARGPLQAPADLLDARSDVLHTAGVELQMDQEGQVLYFGASGELPFQMRAAHPRSTPYPATDEGVVLLPVRQTGRFLIETPDGVPLVLGSVEQGRLELALIGSWPPPPVETWITHMDNTWLQTMVEQILPTADTWTRTALAGQVTRLTEHALPAEATAQAAAGDVSALLRSIAESPAMKPRTWVRTLDARALAAIEQHALRRAAALALDLEDLFTVLPADADDAREDWRKICHRRDDIEGIRVLLREAGTGDSLDRSLTATDRAGRSVRINLGTDIRTSDERLRRVALGDPGAWWGDTAFEVRLI